MSKQMIGLKIYSKYTTLTVNYAKHLSKTNPCADNTSSRAV